MFIYRDSTSNADDVQHQHLRLGRSTLLARGVQEFRGSVRCPTDFGNVRRIDHCWVHDRQLHVLYSHGADFAGGVLVYVSPFLMLFIVVDGRTTVLMNGTGQQVHNSVQRTSC